MYVVPDKLLKFVLKMSSQLTTYKMVLDAQRW